LRFRFKKRRIEVEPQPIVMASLILGWALYYYFSTANKPGGGADSILFIRPLTIALVICFFLLALNSVNIQSEKAEAEAAKAGEAVKDPGFLDRRRIFFAASMVIYAVGLSLFGYLLPSILFIFVVCYYLGVRNFWILTGLPVGLSAFLSLAFKLMKVPVPIWPSW
jgi:putative tricarboxylic transport membrane protein